MKDVGKFCGHLVYFVGILVYFSRLGILYQEKSGNPGSESHPTPTHPASIFCGGKLLTEKNVEQNRSPLSHKFYTRGKNRRKIWRKNQRF
jgi:hypothetical protein